MKHMLLTFLLAGFATGTMPAQAQAQASAASATAAAPAAKQAVKKKIANKAAAADPDEQEPDIYGTSVAEYACELGNQLTVFMNKGDDKHIALKWGKRLHRLERVETSTGAERFENRRYGLVWIGIPAKSMLLDSKNGRQLANECRTAEQIAAGNADAPKKTASALQ